MRKNENGESTQAVRKSAFNPDGSVEKAYQAFPQRVIIVGIDRLLFFESIFGGPDDMRLLEEKVKTAIAQTQMKP